VTEIPEVIKTVERDIPDLGIMGLTIISDIGEKRSIIFEGCVGDGACVAACPENALTMKEVGDDFQLTIDLALCDGVACRRCERACSQKDFDLIKIITSPESESCMLDICSGQNE
jgi:NAD-dependent dihydropyrimidine dehydrogenase PreA subunit